MGFTVCNALDLVDAVLFVYCCERFSNKCCKGYNCLSLVINGKPLLTVKKETMYFHTFIDAAGNWLDTIFSRRLAAIIILTFVGLIK